MFKRFLFLSIIFLSLPMFGFGQQVEEPLIYLTPAVSETIEDSRSDNSVLVEQLYRMIADLQAKIRILSPQRSEVRPPVATTTPPISTRPPITTPAPAPAPEPTQPNVPATPPAQPLAPVPAPAPAPAPTVASFSPTSGAIDARNSNGAFMLVSARTPTEPTSANYPTSDFLISTSRSDLALSINSLNYDSGNKTITPNLNRQIINGERVRLTHKPSGAYACFGFLPGDVDGSGTVAPADQLSLIDAINGVKTLPSYSTDINRSGDTNPADILALIDGFNSGWMGKSLPACPTLGKGQAAPSTQLANIANAISALSARINALMGR